MDEKIKEKGDAYTMGFIVQKGGVEEVARKTGINRQTMRQIASGQNAPSYDSIIKLTVVYPDYDIRKSVGKAPQKLLMAGESTGSEYVDYEESVNVADSVEARLLATENAGLKRENKLLRETVEILRNVVGTQLGKELGVKAESANESTQGKQLKVDLAFRKVEQKRFIPIEMRNAYGFTGRWMNQSSSL